MATVPTVAIIGRPNTGKSTLFNRMVGQQRAIVSTVAGTTRDHVATHIEGKDVDYILIDTGGIGGGSDDHELESNVSAQSILAMENADLIVFTVNAREEITAADRTIVDMLRKKRKRHVPVILAATKCDNDRIMEERLGELHALHIENDFVAVSASHGAGIAELEEAIERHLVALHFQRDVPPAIQPSDNVRVPRIALVGKPNVGKSSLINAFMSDAQRKKSPRIVSPIPGTTRDTSDTVVRHEGKSYCFVDTAGLRRQAKIEGDIEHAAVFRSMRSIANADIVVLVIDSAEPISQQDKRLARMAVEEGRGLIVLANKNDLVPAAERELRLKEIRRDLHFCSFAPFLPVSAVTRENLPKLFALFSQVMENLHRRIPTKHLQSWYENAVQRLPSNILSRGKFVTQADEVPPTIVLFLPNPRRVQQAHVRYLESSLRNIFSFEGVPIRFILKEK